MIITLSPAKLLNFDESENEFSFTKARYEKQANKLNDLLEAFSADEIKGLMSINSKQAVEVFQYIQGFDSSKVSQKQAVLAYNGIAYKGLDAKSFNDEDMAFCQDHLVLLSGLYGALRPLDKIKPYRLEMQIPLRNEKGSNLYDYWSDTITGYLSQKLIKDDKVWINLSSAEYTKVINKKKLPQGMRIITPEFKEQNGKNYRQVVVYTKKARGLLSRYIIKNKLTNVDDIKGFDYEGYFFSEELSDENSFIFAR